MSRRKKTARQLRAEMLQMCGEIHEEDGMDPREYTRSYFGSDALNHASRIDRKTLQLCQQVLRTLQFVLNDCDDPLVQDLETIAVVPHPNSACLCVHVASHRRLQQSQRQSQSREAITAALDRQVDRLRYEIARSIHRKRVPNLVFDVAVGECHDDKR